MRLTATQDWEDLPPPAAEPGTGRAVFGGAGDEAFDLVIREADALVTVRAPPPQAALVQLKLIAVGVLPVQSVRSFFGLGHFGRRVWFYHELRPALPQASRVHWDAHEDQIRAGLLEQGERERAMATFRRRVLGLCHSPATLDALFTQPTLVAQQTWAQRHWFTGSWRLVSRVHPQARAIDNAVRNTLANENFRLQWRLLGRYLDLERGPAWLTTAGHRALRAGVGRIRVETD